MPPRMLGSHIILDLWGVPRGSLDSPSELERLLEDAAVCGGATVVDSCFHRFEPQGVTGVLILAESHVAVHTWPEIGYAAVDVFTCGAEGVADAVADEVLSRLTPSRHRRQHVTRGLAVERKVS